MPVMKFAGGFAAGVLFAMAMAGVGQSGSTDQDWPAEKDAVAAAPESHKVLLKNDKVRVLEVYVGPGMREPEHTHKWPSVMVIVEPAQLRYVDTSGRPAGSGAGSIPATSQPAVIAPPCGKRTPVARWMGPERLHYVENAGDSRFYAIRVEWKEAEKR